METKTKQLLAYLIQNYLEVSVTSLMKLSYIADLVQIKKTNKKISGFRYKRYTYGPFDQEIYRLLKGLVEDGIISEQTKMTPKGDEYIVYTFNEDNSNLKFDKLTKKEKETAQEVVESLQGFGVKALTEVAYRTKPMQKLGATLGGNEHLNALLDLRAE